jgi:hypothetical protein
VPGLDEQQFRRSAEEAKAASSVSRALSGIPEIGMTAKLGIPRSSPTM